MHQVQFSPNSRFLMRCARVAIVHPEPLLVVKALDSDEAVLGKAMERATAGTQAIDILAIARALELSLADLPARIVADHAFDLVPRSPAIDAIAERLTGAGEPERWLERLTGGIGATVASVQVAAKLLGGIDTDHPLAAIDPAAIFAVLPPSNLAIGEHDLRCHVAPSQLTLPSSCRGLLLAQGNPFHDWAVAETRQESAVLAFRPISAGGAMESFSSTSMGRIEGAQSARLPWTTPLVAILFDDAAGAAPVGA